MAGKGSKPRNCFTKEFKDNYDRIDWKLQRKSHGRHERTERWERQEKIDDRRS